MCFFHLGSSLREDSYPNQLKNRGFALANRCYLCHKHEETMDDLLLHCKMTRLLWELLFSLVGISWVNQGTIGDSLESWDGFWFSKK